MVAAGAGSGGAVGGGRSGKLVDRVDRLWNNGDGLDGGRWSAQPALDKSICPHGPLQAILGGVINQVDPDVGRKTVEEDTPEDTAGFRIQWQERQHL